MSTLADLERLRDEASPSRPGRCAISGLTRAEVTFLMTLRNHADALLEVAKAAERFIDLDYGYLAGSGPIDELAAALSRLTDEAEER